QTFVLFRQRVVLVEPVGLRGGRRKGGQGVARRIGLPPERPESGSAALLGLDDGVHLAHEAASARRRWWPHAQPSSPAASRSRRWPTISAAIPGKSLSPTWPSIRPQPAHSKR